MKQRLTYAAIAAVLMTLLAATGCSDLLRGGSETGSRVVGLSRSIAESTETNTMAFEMTVEMCRTDPGWAALGYRNLGLCLRNVKTETGTPPTVTDIDGNVYPIVKIGDQWWMAANLKTTRYSDGSPIEYHDPDEEQQDGTYVWYNHDYENYGSAYGALYDIRAIQDGNLCPVGWHVSTTEEWFTLWELLGWEEGDQAGGAMKSTGTIQDGNGLWQEPNTGATNLSGWSGLPGGRYYLELGKDMLGGDYDRYYFDGIGFVGVWYSTDTEEEYSLPWLLRHNTGDLRYAKFIKDPIIKRPITVAVSVYSVRCVMD